MIGVGYSPNSHTNRYKALGNSFNGYASLAIRLGIKTRTESQCFDDGIYINCGGDNFIELSEILLAIHSQLPRKEGHIAQTKEGR